MLEFQPREVALIDAHTRPTSVHSPLVLRMLTIRSSLLSAVLSEHHVDPVSPEQAAEIDRFLVGPNPFTLRVGLDTEADSPLTSEVR